MKYGSGLYELSNNTCNCHRLLLLGHKEPTCTSFCRFLILKIGVKLEGFEASLLQQDIISQDLIGAFLMHLIMTAKASIFLLDKES